MNLTNTIALSTCITLFLMGCEKKPVQKTDDKKMSVTSKKNNTVQKETSPNPSTIMGNLKTKETALSLMDLDESPMQEEMHELITTWTVNGDLSLHATPRTSAKVVAKIKAVKGQKFKVVQHKTHIITPIEGVLGDNYQQIVSNTFTQADRTPKKRSINAKKGDKFYTYQYMGEGDYIVAVVNPEDKKLVFFNLGADKAPDLNDPSQVQWWMLVNGEKDAQGWLMYNPKQVKARKQMMPGLMPSMN